MTQRVPRIMKKRLKMAIAAAEMLYSRVEREREEEEENNQWRRRRKGRRRMAKGGEAASDYRSGNGRRRVIRSDTGDWSLN